MQTVGAYPNRVLDEIERRGGIDASLRAAGVSAAEIDALRARVIAR